MTGTLSGLFICTGYSCRSTIAEALRAILRPVRLAARSANGRSTGEFDPRSPWTLARQEYETACDLLKERVVALLALPVASMGRNDQQPAPGELGLP